MTIEDSQRAPSLEQVLRFPFNDANLITRSFSQSWQDLFVLSMLDGKKNGLYLEVGAQVPVENNNTYLLHHLFGWNGMSIEIDPVHFYAWSQQRPNSNLVIADALAVDYHEAFQKWYGSNHQLDYLQLDIDPSINTLKVLQKLPLDDYRFSVITFETDAYTNDLTAQIESRKILSAYGYELVCPNVGVLFSPVSNDLIPFEDWWVDPAIVSREKINALKQQTNSLKDLVNPQEMIFNLSNS